jgi:hypothetical protein
MMHNFSEQDPATSKIKGLIFISDTEIKSEENYKNPKIIAFSTPTNDDDFKKYASNNDTPIPKPDPDPKPGPDPGPNPPKPNDTNSTTGN